MEGLGYLPKAKRIYIERKIKQQKYTLIQEYNSKQEWSIAWMCKMLGISRSAYYKWIKRTETNYSVENKEIIRCI